MSDVGIDAKNGTGFGRTRTFGAAPWIATVFLSAGLVFLVQPMFAKMATPLLGGAPAVWNVALVCFQAALLAGYAYAHGLARISSVRTQVAIHGVLLAAAAFALPMTISTLFGTPDPAHPILWLAGTFLVSIAPPFAIISATAPLIQSWYAKSGRPDADDPYHLYAASNAGSLIGLSAYPLLLEPFTAVSQQSLFWSLGYGALALLILGCGLLAMRASTLNATGITVTHAPAMPSMGERSAIWRERCTWLLLSAVPSGLLLGATTHISTDVASAPFLWAPPLMAYIATFIIVFSKKPIIPNKVAAKYLPHLIAIAVALLALGGMLEAPLALSLATHIGVLFLTALVLHGALANLRPSAERLTEFYLIMSAGGVIGAGAIALIAPVVFNGIWEYPLMLLGALLLRPMPETLKESYTNNRTLIGLIGVCLIVFALLGLSGVDIGPRYASICVLIAVSAAILRTDSRLVPVIALATALVIGTAMNPMQSTTSERGFFGVVRTVNWEEQSLRTMVHGTTIHGAQRTNEAGAPTPLTYYHRDAPIGQVFSALGNKPGTVGVVGLGLGSVACYIGPNTKVIYYEIDPIVARIARDATRFNFLSECTPDAPIVLGDARLTLEEAAPASFDLLLLDAFSSDAIPAHLITREAMTLYLSRLTDDGILLVHISNRHLELAPTLARIGASEGAVMRIQKFRQEQLDIYHSASQSDVVMIAKSEEALAEFNTDARWQPLESDGKRPWTDDYSNIIGAMLDNHDKSRN